MNTSILSRWLALVIVFALVITPATAKAKASKNQCTGTEIPLGLLDPGVWTTPGGNVHVRGMVSQFLEESSCPQTGGVNTSTMNAEWDAAFSGPMQGTWHLETDYGGGGVWEGTWQGVSNVDGSYAYEAVGHGISGSVLGLKITTTAQCAGPGLQVSFTSILHDPHGT